MILITSQKPILENMDFPQNDGVWVFLMCFLFFSKGHRIFQVLVKGGRSHEISQLAVYTAYIPGIVLAFVWGLHTLYHLLAEPE